MFDIERVKNHRTQNSDSILNSSYYDFIADDIISRLEPIDHDFQQILIINYHEMIIDKFRSKLQAQYQDAKIITISDIVELKSYHHQFDLILFPFTLHWIGNVQELLSDLFQAMKSNAIFFCNFAADASLRNLRYKLIEFEAKYSKPHVAHISPFIQFDQVTPLLQQAGFKENIIDMEDLVLEHNSILSLMKFIKNLGESNTLISTPYFAIDKDMYKDCALILENKFVDYIKLVTILSSPIRGSIKLKSSFYTETRQEGIAAT